EDLELHARLRVLDRLEQQDRDRVGLLPGGAARNPGAEHAVAAARDQLRQRPLERRERLGVAEEAAHADQPVARERGELAGVLLEEADVGRQIAELVEL